MLPRHQLAILHGDPVHIRVLATPSGHGWTVVPCGSSAPYDLDQFPPARTDRDGIDMLVDYIGAHPGDCCLTPVVQHKDGRRLFIHTGIMNDDDPRYATFYAKPNGSLAKFAGGGTPTRHMTQAISNLREWAVRNHAAEVTPWLDADRCGAETRGGAVDRPEPTLRVLPIESIVPGDNPRTMFDQQYLAELSASIVAQGLLLPVVVRDLRDGRYQLIDGACRLRACQIAGITEIEAVVREADDLHAFLCAIAANNQRAGLNPIEEARAYERAHAAGTPIKEIAVAAGRSPEAISNLRRLLKLPEDMQHSIATGALTMAHGKALCAHVDHPPVLRYQYGRALNGTPSKDIERLDYATVEALVRAGHARRMHDARFRRDEADCKGCNHSRGITGDGYCLNPTCYDEHQAAAPAPSSAAPMAAPEPAQRPRVQEPTTTESSVTEPVKRASDDAVSANIEQAKSDLQLGALVRQVLTERGILCMNSTEFGDGGIVYRAYTRPYFDPTSCGGECCADDPADALREALGDPSREPSARKLASVCRICGCTEDHACEGGCTWANADETLCSACTVECPCCGTSDGDLICDVCHGHPCGADTAAIMLAQDLMEVRRGDADWSDYYARTALRLLDSLGSCEHLPAGPLSDLCEALRGWSWREDAIEQGPSDDLWTAIEAVATMKGDD